MKYIKKVSVAQLESNTGTIIDSMNPGDDQHTNAPSIDAVKNYVGNFNTYSTTEDIPVGVWIDGKTIYRRVMTSNTLQSSYYMDKLSGSNKFNEVIFVEGFFNRKDYTIHQNIPSRTSDAYMFEWKNFTIGGTGATAGDTLQIDVAYGSSITNNTFKDITIIVYFTKATS